MGFSFCTCGWMAYLHQYMVKKHMSPLTVILKVPMSDKHFVNNVKKISWISAVKCQFHQLDQTLLTLGHPYCWAITTSTAGLLNWNLYVCKGYFYELLTQTIPSSENVNHLGFPVTHRSFIIHLSACSLGDPNILSKQKHAHVHQNWHCTIFPFTFIFTIIRNWFDRVFSPHCHIFFSRCHILCLFRCTFTFTHCKAHWELYVRQMHYYFAVSNYKRRQLHVWDWWRHHGSAHKGATRSL